MHMAPAKDTPWLAPGGRSFLKWWVDIPQGKKKTLSIVFSGGAVRVVAHLINWQGRTS
jgi:hypothetical protein